MLYSFMLHREVCPRCKINLVGEGTIKVEGNLYSVNEGGQVVENDTDMLTSLILDLKFPEISCQSCEKELDFSYQSE